MSARIRFLLCTVVGGGALTGCASETETTAEHMQEHFTRATAVHAAVMMGDLDALREPAQWLADHDVAPGLPPNWEPYVAEMRAAAEQLLTQDDLAGAAAAASAMAQTCGNCHAALAGGVHFTAGPAPAAEPGAVAHMLRHNWAAERMWEGLTGPSNEAWMKGVDALADAPLDAEQLGGPPVARTRISTLAQQVHALAGQAGEAVEPNTRAEVYGRFLATCARCHELAKPAE